MEFVSSISVCGSWWRDGTGLERGVDNVPRGYRVVEVRGNHIRHRYVSSGESKVDRQGEFLGLDRPVPPSRSSALVFNCYDAPNGSTARARIDSGPWTPMSPHTDQGGSVKMRMPHHFLCRTDTTGLAPGRHQVTAEVTWPDGTVVTETAGLLLGSPVAATGPGVPSGKRNGVTLRMCD